MSAATLPTPATAGEIASINLESARQAAWSRFWRAPDRPGAAESIIEHERIVGQFFGDVNVLTRLDGMVREFERATTASAATALVRAQVAAMGHRFAEARASLAEAERCGAPSDAVERLSLSIDQACGTRLDAVLTMRRRTAKKSPRLENLVPLASLLADLREFGEADRVYRDALGAYDDVSPFALAWACFQLGMLWGELAIETRPEIAEQWYRQAIAYVPGYVTASVHLSELLAARGAYDEAHDLLNAVSGRGDPEIRWRLADVLLASGRSRESSAQLARARREYDDSLAGHPLAFADHAAEFFAGSGGDARRAMELAQMNLENRPTLRAFELAYSTAVGAGEAEAAARVLRDAVARWGESAGFKMSSLAEAGA